MRKRRLYAREFKESAIELFKQQSGEKSTKEIADELEIIGTINSTKEVKTALFEYIEIYHNRYRRHSALGYATPLALTPNIAA